MDFELQIIRGHLAKPKGKGLIISRSLPSA
jgi:hypothetical protein